MRVLAVLLVLSGAVLGDRYHAGGDLGADPSGEGAAPPGEDDMQYWVRHAQDDLAARLSRREPRGPARNVVMFLGDGMSVPTLAAARTLLGQRTGRPGEETQLYFETFPTTGLVKTYCVDAQVADSACSATSYLCGVKGNRGTVGVSGRVSRGQCGAATNASHHAASLATWALRAHRDVGIVTTTRVTHASPAGTFAKAADRNWETDADILGAGYQPATCPDITHQLVHHQPGASFKVILGGGRRTFLPTSVLDEEGAAGRRTDGRNLIDEWRQDKAARNLSHAYVWNRSQLMALNEDPPEYLLGLFESSHMQYHAQSNLETEPTLAELTETAIKMLSRNENGFFLFVEGGRIDHAHHDNYVHLALDETIEMDKAVRRATELLSEEDSLVVVTSDHAHVMTFNGYSARGRDILGRSRDTDRNRVPYMTLSYANGPGYRPQVNGVRPDVTAENNYGELRWRSHVDVPLSSETHGGDDVAVFVRGPYHHLFTGLYEQSHLPHLVGYAACLGPGLTACSQT